MNNNKYKDFNKSMDQKLKNNINPIFDKNKASFKTSSDNNFLVAEPQSFLQGLADAMDCKNKGCEVAIEFKK